VCYALKVGLRPLFFVSGGMNELEKRVAELVAPVARDHGTELLLVEFRQEGGRWVLRLYLDKEGDGVTLEDCWRVSRDAERLLDVEDWIEQRYALEVSSPGLDRPLVKPADYTRFAGQRAKVRTTAPVGGARNFTGRLRGETEARIRIELDDGRVEEIPYELVERARLVPEL